MKIVVTGAKGRIGAVLVDYARSQGAQVLGVDSVVAGAGGNSILPPTSPMPAVATTCSAAQMQ